MDNDNVLIVTQLFPPESGGNASRISDMAENLIKLGLGVSILSPVPTFPFGTFRRTNRLWQRRKVNGIDIINIWTWQPSSGDPGFISRMAYYLLFALHSALWTLFNAKRYRVIITTAPPLFLHLAGLLPGYLLGKPWIVDVRDMWIDVSISLGFLKKGSAYEKLSRWFERLCFSRADLICVTTEETKKKLLARYSAIGPGKVVLIPNGVDMDKFSGVPLNKQRQIIYTGNVGYAQDLEKVVLAMKCISEKHDVKLVIVGEGDMKDRLIGLVHENGLGDRVIFKDLVRRDEVPGLIAESYLGVAPLKAIETLEYAIPTKVFEYMACGIPFVGCSNGEIANIAKKSGAGIIAQNDIHSIADAICRLLENPGLNEDMGKKGRQYVEKHYDRKNIARALREEIARIA